MKKLFKDLYDYREFLKTSIKKDIRGKYKGAWLGVLWSFINPLLTLMVYAIIFPLIMKSKIPNYLMYLMTGLMPWNFFTNAINFSCFSIISNAGIVKKVYFPREIIPISVVLSNAIMFCITCVIIVIFLFGTGVGLSWYALLFPVILFLQIFLLLGFSLILSAITVYAQDVQHIVSVILMAAFYGTPIVYDASSIPAQYKFILYLNPMTPIVTAYRDILFYQKMPNWAHLGYLFIFCIFLFYIGLAIFRKLQKGFVEEI